MIYGVKFCGGCNPRFDRGKALSAIKGSIGERVTFEAAQDGRDYDGLLVIGGCTNCCPEYKHYNVKRPPVKLCEERHISKTIETIKKEAD